LATLNTLFLLRNNSCIDLRAEEALGSGSPGGLSGLDIHKMNVLYDCSRCLGHRWINGMDNVSNPFLSGYDIYRDELVSFRAYHNGDIMPGEGVLKYAQCYVTYNGTETRIGGKNVQFLTNPYGANLKWIRRVRESVPDNLINRVTTLF